MNKAKTIRVQTAVKKKYEITSGHTSLNDTYPTNNYRFVTSSKSKRSGVKPKMQNDIKEFTMGGNFNRIYTPQNYLNLEKKLGRRLNKKNSKNKTVISNEIDFKSSGEPVNISTHKISNLSLNTSSKKQKNRFRVSSAQHNYFNRLQSANKLKQSSLLDRTKLNSFSAKDWQIIPVQNDNQTYSKPMRS